MRRTATVLLAAALVLLAAAGGVAWAATISCPDNDPGDPEPEFCSGTDEDDTIYGTAGRDYMRGGSGADVLYGRRGPDWIGEGNDDTDRDRVYGGPGDDEIWDNDPEEYTRGRDEKHGGPGDDFIVGHEAPEWIFGGGGNDEIRDLGARGVIRCGPGRDTVRYAPGVQKVADDCEVRNGEPAPPS